MSIKLVAIDMDGTLLNSATHVSQQNKEAIVKAMAKGILIVPTTGRSYKNIKNVLINDLPRLPYYVSSNGAIVVNGKREEIIYERVMKREDIKAVYEIVKKYPVFTEIYSGFNAYADEQGIYHFYRSVFEDEQCNQFLETATIVKDLSTIIGDDSISISKFDIISETAKVNTKLKNEIAEIDGLYPVTIIPEGMELIEGKWCKRDGLKELIGKLNIRQEEVMVIGDSDNDIEMMEWSPNAVAMGNANDKVKSLANYITGTNDEAGVAQALYEYLDI